MEESVALQYQYTNRRIYCDVYLYVTEVEELGLSQLEEDLPMLVDADEPLENSSSNSINTPTVASTSSEYSTSSNNSSPITENGSVAVQKKKKRKRKISQEKSDAIKKLKHEQTAQREKIASVIETEVKKVSDTACRFMDGILDCCNRLTDALIKKIEECPSETVVRHLSCNQ